MITILTAKVSGGYLKSQGNLLERFKAFLCNHLPVERRKVCFCLVLPVYRQTVATTVRKQKY